jgi:two-component system, OmpR family, sensor kinase
MGTDGPPHHVARLETLERLLAIEVGDLETALTHSCNVIADALHADKVDAFLYEPAKDTLVALGSSTQPLSALQKKLGLDMLPVSNGGRVVFVFQTGQTFVTGHLDQDAEELRGVKQGLGIRSKIGVPLHVAGDRRGMVMIASLQPDFFSAEDVAFAESIVRWVGVVTHKAELGQEIARNAVAQGRRAVAEELITVLAHDLRNFVTPIGARLQLMRRRALRDQRERDVGDCDAADRAIGRLNRLIADLLDVARLDQGILKLDIQPVNLAGMAQEVASALATPDHPVDVSCGEETVIAADPDRLRQCVENLVANAMRYSPRDAPVQINVSRERHDDSDCGVLEVRDQGPGIAADVMPHIFERFSAGAKSVGLGLGLYLAKSIAAAHGGDLTVASTPGKGAQFVLKLPSFRDTATADDDIGVRYGSEPTEAGNPTVS